MKKILVLTDLSRRAEHAAEIAMDIASRAGASITLYNVFYVPEVVPAMTTVYPFYEDFAAIEAENISKLERMSKRLTGKFEAGHNCAAPPVEIQQEAGTLGSALPRFLKENRFWLIVMGDTSEDGLFVRFISGKDSHIIIDKVGVPVLMIPENVSISTGDKIGFSSCLDRAERKALPFLTGFAELWESEIDFIHVLSGAALTTDEKLWHADQFEKIVEHTDYSDIFYKDIVSDNVVRSLYMYVKKEKPGILALRHHKRGFFGKMFNKSVSKEVMDFHNIPLLILPD